ncbi:hypothetical protein [Compostibacter hankyongensis]|uniref:Uncharacterized protein n=1 Tax=Compostibacter hankyongensis TaxID=1007089 RepID=A0ABP8G3Y1_9BACT
MKNKIYPKWFCLLPLLLFVSVTSPAQITYDETTSIADIPHGILYQSGPGATNQKNWKYFYGTKLTVNGNGLTRNFELCTTKYPYGEMVFRQWDTNNNRWMPWRRFVLQDTLGNVLIGKTSQTNTSYKLDVNGNVRANKVVVNTTGADFVFDSAYHLPELSKVEDYIQKHRHLPDITPAYKMQAEGLDLGDNQVKLLQKIEELTLYTIDQDKRLSVQQATTQRQQDLLQKQAVQLEKLCDQNTAQQSQLQTQQQLLDRLSAVVKAQEARLKTLEEKLTR